MFGVGSQVRILGRHWPNWRQQHRSTWSGRVRPVFPGTGVTCWPDWHDSPPLTTLGSQKCNHGNQQRHFSSLYIVRLSVKNESCNGMLLQLWTLANWDDDAGTELGKHYPLPLPSPWLITTHGDNWHGLIGQQYVDIGVWRCGGRMMRNSCDLMWHNGSAQLRSSLVTPASCVNSVDTTCSVPDQKLFCCLSSLHNSAESDQNITTISCYFQSNGTISNQSFSTLPTLFTCGWILLYIGNMDSHKPTKHIHHRVKDPHGIVNPPLIEQDFLSHRRFRKIWVSAIPSFNWFCMMGGNFNEEKRVLLTC